MRDSRRARWVLGALLVVSLVLIVVDARGGSGPLRGFGSTVLGPVERAATTVARPIGDFFSAIGGIGSNARRADELQARNDELETRLRELESDIARVEQLDQLLGLAGEGRFRIVPAQVIAAGPTQGFAYTVTLDVGREDRIRVDQTVINGQGLVGRVTSVGRTTSTVLLVVDPSSTVGARLAGSRQLGLINGRGDTDLELQLLNPRSEVEEGDALVTFGAQRSPFVPGVPIGTVTSVRGTPGSLSRIARVKPYVDMDALDLVGVVLGRPADDPRDSLIPPKPRPTTAPATTAPATAPPASTTAPPTLSTRTATPSPSPTGG